MKLGLDRELEEADPKSPRFIVVNGQLRAIPLGPLTFGGILRAMAEPAIRSKSQNDESVARLFPPALWHTSARPHGRTVCHRHLCGQHRKAQCGRRLSKNSGDRKGTRKRGLGNVARSNRRTREPKPGEARSLRSRKVWRRCRRRMAARSEGSNRMLRDPNRKGRSGKSHRPRCPRVSRCRDSRRRCTPISQRHSERSTTHPLWSPPRRYRCAICLGHCGDSGFCALNPNVS